jgi:SAM-dependent methyltransferase
VDLASRAYNPVGRASASSFTFPFSDASFDYVLLGSVFTHMLPADVEQYVREIGRLLAPGGVCVASWFLLNDDTRGAVDAGRGFISFDVPHGSGVCRLHDATVPEAAVAYDEPFVRRIHARAALQIDDVRRGGWWKGTQHDQDVLTVTTRADRPAGGPSRTAAAGQGPP